MSQDLRVALLLNISNKNIVKYLQLAPPFTIFYFLPQKYEKIRSKMCLSGLLLCLSVIIYYIIMKLFRDVNRVYVPIILVLTFK